MVDHFSWTLLDSTIIISISYFSDTQLFYSVVSFLKKLLKLKWHERNCNHYVQVLNFGIKMYLSTPPVQINIQSTSLFPKVSWDSPAHLFFHSCLCNHRSHLLSLYLSLLFLQIYINAAQQHMFSATFICSWYYFLRSITWLSLYCLQLLVIGNKLAINAVHHL